MKLLLPDEARALVARKYDSYRRTWLDDGGSWPLSIPLGSVTEKSAIQDLSGVRAWATAWAAWNGPGEVTWVERRWTGSTQRIPASLSISTPADAARLASRERDWTAAVARRSALVRRWPTLAAGAVSRHFDELCSYNDDDFYRLVNLLTWLEANPESGHYVRHLPVKGLDTKWIRSRQGMVTRLLAAIRSLDGTGDFHAVCGLSRPPERARLRLLCPELRRITGGLCDIAAPLAELEHLPIRPTRVIVVENQETGVALRDIAGTVAFQELGNAVGLLGRLPWLKSVPILYWGDLDTHGFAILNQARQVLPQVRSLLMDEATLLAHETMWVTESPQHSAAKLPFLTAQEHAVYDGLKAGTWGKLVRLEQERLPWAYSMERLMHVIGGLADEMVDAAA